ncbi:hypothetical protein KC669_04400 [Candidatus Dojkabacteria bacterium]|uniref:Type II secretion system protein n=1 Tax=Candidatus Dojkabacteria bacterium TaxID=2099670 RepID=A0A955LBZ9_9BACT|nr:hypothetical protein [Candidatus Dojkabacteria bacterium]
MDQQTNSKKAFTLIETLLYISLTSIILVSISAFMGLLININNRNKAISEVNHQSIEVLENITASIQNAEGINSPAQSSSGNSLSLQIDSASSNPTVVGLSGTRVIIQEGASSPVFITSDDVIVNDLTFYNVSTNLENKGVRFSFTIEYNNTSGRSEFNLTKTFYGTATIK